MPKYNGKIKVTFVNYIIICFNFHKCQVKKLLQLQEHFFLTLLLVPPPVTNSVPEHGVLVDLSQRVGDLHGLTNSRMQSAPQSVQGVGFVGRSRCLAPPRSLTLFFLVTTQEFHMQRCPPAFIELRGVVKSAMLRPRN